MLLIFNITRVMSEYKKIYYHVEHSHQLFYKKCHFDTSKAYFTILPHYFIISHLLNIISFNPIY